MPLLKPKPVNNFFTKNKLIAVLATINAALLAMVLMSRDAVKKAKLMYEHPAVVTKTEYRAVKGPVRIVERIVKVPSGEVVTERTISRDATTITKGSDSSSTPIAVIMPAAPRYLVGGSWRASDERNATLWLGYSFWNRLDVLGGVGYKTGDKFNASLMVLTRWGK